MHAALDRKHRESKKEDSQTSTWHSTATRYRTQEKVPTHHTEVGLTPLDTWQRRDTARWWHRQARTKREPSSQTMCHDLTDLNDGFARFLLPYLTGMMKKRYSDKNRNNNAQTWQRHSHSWQKATMENMWQKLELCIYCRYEAGAGECGWKNKRNLITDHYLNCLSCHLLWATLGTVCTSDQREPCQRPQRRRKKKISKIAALWVIIFRRWWWSQSVVGPNFKEKRLAPFRTAQCQIPPLIQLVLFSRGCRLFFQETCLFWVKIWSFFAPHWGLKAQNKWAVDGHFWPKIGDNLDLCFTRFRWRFRVVIYTMLLELVNHLLRLALHNVSLFLSFSSFSFLGGNSNVDIFQEKFVFCEQGAIRSSSSFVSTT